MQLPEEALEALDARKSSLVEEAQAALATTLSERDILVGRIRRANAVEDDRRAKAEAVKDVRQQMRYATLAKWFAFISLPLILLSALLNPAQAWQTLLSASVQAVLLFLVIGAALFAKRRFRAKGDKSDKD